MARTPGNWYWFRPGKEHYDEVVAAAADAFSKGYSVIEISRFLKMKGCRHLYSALRAKGFIPVLPRRRGRVFDIPKPFSEALAKCGIGYLQWCQSHCFDADEVSFALSHPLDQFDPLSHDVHLAFYRDFYRVYARVFPGSGMYEDAVISKSFEPELSPTFVLAPEGIKYCAFLKEREQTVSFGQTPEQALSNLMLALAVQKTILRLSNLSRR